MTFHIVFQVLLPFLRRGLEARDRDPTTSFPGPFSFELGRREKTLASAGHVPILHPKILGALSLACVASVSGCVAVVFLPLAKTWGVGRSKKKLIEGEKEGERSPVFP